MFDFQFSEYVESFLSGRMRAAAAAHHLERRNDPAIGRYVHYLDTHDTVPMTDRLESDAAYQVALVLLFTNAGMPLLYYGDELAREGSTWPNNRPDMPWDRVEGAGRATLELTRQLTQIRRDHPALSRGSWTTLQAEEGLLAYSREYRQEDADDRDDRIVVAVNRGPEAASLACPEGVSCEPLLCLRCQVADGQVTLEANGAVVLAGE
jgi:glycosidase